MTDTITKCDSYFIKKCVKGLLQNVSDFLLQNGFLQNVRIISKCDDFIRKCDSYYKMCWYTVDCEENYNRLMQDFSASCLLEFFLEKFCLVSLGE